MAKHIIKTKNIDLLEKSVIAIAIIEPLSTVPQIVDIYSQQDAHSVSLLSWLLFMAASVTWLAYGLKIKNIPLIASSVVWVTTEIILVIGILRFS